MIPCKKVNYPDWKISAIERYHPVKVDLPLYKTHTFQSIYIFKNMNTGLWHYYMEREERLSKGYYQKNHAVEDVEKIEQPSITYTGANKIHSARMAPIHATEYANRTLSLTGQSQDVWETYTNDYIDQLVEHSKNFYHVDLSGLIRTISFANSWKARRSFAGVKKGNQKVFIRLAAYMQKSWLGKHHFNEYNHIANDPDIGSICSDSFEDMIKVLCIHEIAHCIRRNLSIDNTQFAYTIDPSIIKPCFGFENRKVYADTSKKSDGDHAAVWQSIYCEMRKKFLPEFSNKKEN